jgi:protocatechuate 3,4-dioxygenase beta subunit
MRQRKRIRAVALVALVGGLLAMAAAGKARGEQASGEDQILKITVGPMTQVHEESITNAIRVFCSPTGAIGVIYGEPWPDNPGRRYDSWRVSHDGGESWSEPIFQSWHDELDTQVSENEAEAAAAWQAAKPGTVLRSAGAMYLEPGETDWFTTHFNIYTDDLLSFTRQTARVYVPGMVLSYQEGEPLEHTWAGPVWYTYLALPNGELRAAVTGTFQGDTRGSIIMLRSADHGRTWFYHGIIAHSEVDPNPEFPGEFGSFSEVSLTPLPDNELLAIFRAQGSHLPPDYKPMYQCRSTDFGRTWSEPVVAEPQLINIFPALETLENGVVACLYGRPGFHIAFSTDNGETWPQRVTFTHEPVYHTGQNHMVKVGPNKLIATGGLPGQGSVVIPVTVERVKDPMPGPFEVTGRVVDGEGKPLAGAQVQWGPQAYTRANFAPVEYEAIESDSGLPVVVTDAQGAFRFADRSRGGAVLTVQAQGYAPLVHHVTAAPDMGEIMLTLQPGAAVVGKVVDETGQPVAGVCVYLNEAAHVHTDLSGQYAWPIVGEVPAEVKLRLVRIGYVHVAQPMMLSQLKQPLVMRQVHYPDAAPTLPVVRVDAGKGPELETGIDEGAWADVPVAGEFLTQSIGSANAADAKAKFCYDGRYLYGIVKLTPAEGHALSQDDVVEFYVDSASGMKFQFAFNNEGRLPGLFAWNTPYTVGKTTQHDDGSWTVMVRTMWLQLNMAYPAPVGIGIVHSQKGPLGEGLPTVYRFGRLQAKRGPNDRPTHPRL